MTVQANAPTTASDPVDALFEILDRFKQFDKLIVESGETETIPANEVWYVSGEITIEGDLNTNGELVSGTVWTNGTPEIDYWNDVNHKAKENRQADAIYLHTTGTDGIERFSADKGTIQETNSVLASVWTLGDATLSKRKAARNYRDDIVDIARGYMNDNFEFTEFHNIEPTESNDFRSQHNPRDTDHYIYTVEIETERLK